MFLANLKYMTIKQLEEQELRMMTNQGQLHDTSSVQWAIQGSDKALLPYQEMQLHQIEEELTQMQARIERPQIGVV